MYKPCSLAILPVLFAPPALAQGAPPEVVVNEPGFVVSEEVNLTTGFSTQMAFGPDGRLFVGLVGGEVIAYPYDADGIAGPGVEVASNIGGILLGIAFDDAGALYASSGLGPEDTGFIGRLEDLDSDGLYETQSIFVWELPSALHQNDQLAIVGTRLFFGMGSRSDGGESDGGITAPAATLLSVDLSTVDFNVLSNPVDVWATGLRNAFGIAVDPLDRVWVCDNARQVPHGIQDELHLIEQGKHHGFPFETAPIDIVEPIALLGQGTSADGMDFAPAEGRWGSEFAGDLFIVRFADDNDDPALGGHDIVRVQFEEFETEVPIAETSIFAEGLVQPLDAVFDPYGNLIVSEYGGRILRIARSLGSTHDSIDLASGGMQTLHLEAGADHSSEISFIIGSVTGTSPAIPLTPEWSLPLVPDFYFNQTVSQVGQAPLPDSPLFLSAEGSGTAGFVLSAFAPATAAQLAGLTVYHAFVVFDSAAQVAFTSGATSVELKL